MKKNFLVGFIGILISAVGIWLLKTFQTDAESAVGIIFSLVGLWIVVNEVML